MAEYLDSTGNHTHSLVTSFNISWPTVESGDRVFLSIAVRDGTAQPSVPSGFTLLEDRKPHINRWTLWTKVADGTESGSENIVHSGGAARAYSATFVRMHAATDGSALGNHFDHSPVLVYDNFTSTVTWPQLTPSGATNTMVLLVHSLVASNDNNIDPEPDFCLDITAGTSPFIMTQRWHALIVRGSGSVGPFDFNMPSSATGGFDDHYLWGGLVTVDPGRDVCGETLLGLTRPHVGYIGIG